MKLNKIFILWLVLVVMWNFWFPSVPPIYDVIAAVLLSFLSKYLEKKI
jgi:hypothetical protein